MAKNKRDMSARERALARRVTADKDDAPKSATSASARPAAAKAGAEPDAAAGPAKTAAPAKKDDRLMAAMRKKILGREPGKTEAQADRPAKPAPAAAKGTPAPGKPAATPSPSNSPMPAKPSSKDAEPTPAKAPSAAKPATPAPAAKPTPAKAAQGNDGKKAIDDVLAAKANSKDAGTAPSLADKAKATDAAADAAIAANAAKKDATKPADKPAAAKSSDAKPPEPVSKPWASAKKDDSSDPAKPAEKASGSPPAKADTAAGKAPAKDVAKPVSPAAVKDAAKDAAKDAPKVAAKDSGEKTTKDTPKVAAAESDKPTSVWSAVVDEPKAGTNGTAKKADAPEDGEEDSKVIDGELFAPGAVATTPVTTIIDPDDEDDEDEDDTPAVGAPLQDERFIERARRQDERARKAQAKEEAKRLRAEAKQMLVTAKKREKTQAVLEAHMEKVATIGEDLGYDPERPITRIPELPATRDEVSFRVIEEDRAFIRLSFDNEQHTYEYEIIEPKLTPNETKIMEFLRDTLVRTLDGRRGQDSDWAQYLRDAVQQAIVDHDILIDHISTERILYYLIRDFLGYGPIDILMRDDQLEDVSCDGPGIPIYIFHRQHESIRSSVSFSDDLEIDAFVIRLAQRSGKHISVADPLLDATLPDGSRLQATLSREVTSRGSSFTIRKFREEPFTPPDLINYGTVTTPMCAYFWFLMQEGRSLIYAGGTASGKTTSLNAWCQFIPPEKKIVSIEDTREINLLHENWIAGVTRSGFGGETASGKRAGSIDMYRLLEAALRQRPEYLLVGEVRGAEALTLFQAMATGHAVYSTMHADSAKSAVYRLENPPINVPRMMLQTLDTIVIQGQVKVGDRMGRRVKEVVEIIGFDPDTDDLLTNTVFYWEPTTDRHIFTGHSGVFDQIQDKKGWSDEEFQKEWERRMLVLEWMRKKEITHFKEFSRIIHEYYQRPDKVMARIAEDQFELDPSISAGSTAGDTTAMYGAGSSLDDRVAPWRPGDEPVDVRVEKAAEAAGGARNGSE